MRMIVKPQDVRPGDVVEGFGPVYRARGDATGGRVWDERGMFLILEPDEDVVITRTPPE